MACCCKEREQETTDLSTPLSFPDIASPSPPPLTLSPMNSNFTALSSGDLLQSILERLPPRDLARSACVCRLWRAVASDRAMLERAFAGPWGVKRVVGTPSSTAFWRCSSLTRFAISHRLSRGDTVAGLALKYSVQVMEIKRLNNMMSDHGIYSRQRLLIPITKPELLSGATCYIELDEHAKREVAVLYVDGGGPSNESDCQAGINIKDRRKKRILDSVRRSLHVDDGTAEYYLSAANGDPRAAMMQYSEDLRWEQQNTHM
ncbi:peptidoglycan-binding LysM domain-containing protein [Rhynchospora pubera]|uniref:Peptidoglycan-binding LysM domain-containing protein n=1 Tax=Rhynchospora pubera TaxID=906938 RepID=A0AAV8HG87_9POAL|nr:peptidoglycan-binding LysM domain-containing protein [Rhynchospora pubera]